MTDDQGVIKRANAAFTRMSGYKTDEVIGFNLVEYCSNDFNQDLMQDISTELLVEGYWQGGIPSPINR